MEVGLDADSFRVNLQAGHTYEFLRSGLYEGVGTLRYGFQQILNAAGEQLAWSDVDVMTFQPQADGPYYLQVSGESYFNYPDVEFYSGTYVVSATDTGQTFPFSTFSFDRSSLQVKESDGTATLTVKLDKPAESDTEISYTAYSGTATVFDDFNRKSERLTFAAGQTSKTISIPILNDTLPDEGDENFTVVLSNPSGANLTNTTATVTIADDDAASSNLRFADARIEDRLDADGDGYARQLKIAFDVDSDAPSQYYVKVYEEDLLSDDPLVTSERFDVAGTVKDYHSVEIGVDEHLRLPGFDTFSRGAAEFRLDLFDAATDALVKTWRTPDDPDLGNVLVEASDEDYDETGVSQSGNDFIDGLLTGYKWGVGREHTGATITYSFPADNANWPADYKIPFLSQEPDVGYEPLDRPLQKSTIETALKQWADVSQISWVPVEDGVAYGEVRFAGSSASPLLAWTKPLRFAETDSDGDVWFNTASWQTAWSIPTEFEPGQEWIWAVLHEVGHALGLDHPWDQGVSDFTFVPPQREWIGWTVMSYKVLEGIWWEGSVPANVPDPVTARSESLTPDVYPSTPMWLDIEAIRYLYGAKDTNTGNNSGDRAYVFNEGQSYFKTIVDDGGIDEIRYDSKSDGAKIDLRPGQWNELGKQITYTHGGVERQRRDGNVILYQDANAENPFDSLIENATGGGGPDEITGNDAANVLKGNGGDDTLQGGPGIDTLDGGSEFDTVLYRDAPSAVRVDLENGTAEGGDGSDTLISIEKVIGSPFADVLIGSAGDDVLDGRQGDDTLEGEPRQGRANRPRRHRHGFLCNFEGWL